MLASLERAVVSNPQNAALQMSLESIATKTKALTEQFDKQSSLQQVDVCDYRLIKEGEGSYPIIAVGDSLKNFQLLLSVIFDAVKTGAKVKSRPSAEVMQQTQLDYGYSYAGSLGMVFTIPNERRIADDSDLDLAVKVLFRMLKLHSGAELAEFAREYGISTIRKMYAWADTHSKYGFATDIKWKKSPDRLGEVFLQSAEAENLCRLIVSTSDVQREDLRLEGELVGGDTVTKEFHLRFPQGEDIKGKFDAELAFTGNLVLNKRYRVHLAKETKVFYATEREDTNYFLLGLEPL